MRGIPRKGRSYCGRDGHVALLLVALILPAPSSAQVPSAYAGKPYRDSAAALPGRLEMERYDLGNRNVTWFDMTPGLQVIRIEVAAP